MEAASVQFSKPQEQPNDPHDDDMRKNHPFLK